MEDKIVICNPVRTPIGSFGGQFKDIPASYLLAVCFWDVLKKSGINPDKISEVIAGTATHSSDAPNVARTAALMAGVPFSVPAFSVQRNCASGLQAITSAVQAMEAGDGEIFLVGGTENMSRIPYIVRGARFGYKQRHQVLTDSLWEGLTDPITGEIMGKTAENIAKQYKISREDQDRWAARSHDLAFRARQYGLFKEQIVAVAVDNLFSVAGNNVINPNSLKVITQDESINPGMTWDKAAKAPSIFTDPAITKVGQTEYAFKDGKIILNTALIGPDAEPGTVTANNSCPLSDGASAMLITTESMAEELNLEPVASIVAYAYAGCNPFFMGMGPVFAVTKALSRAVIDINQVDIFEINEAFAAPVLACIRQLGIPEEKVNIWGGAIALGHPVGATGVCLTTKAVYMLKYLQKHFATVTMCIGGGQGGALILKRYEK